MMLPYIVSDLSVRGSIRSIRSLLPVYPLMRNVNRISIECPFVAYCVKENHIVFPRWAKPSFFQPSMKGRM